MLEMTDIWDIVSNISYKPGWTVNACEDEILDENGRYAGSRPYIQISVTSDTEAALCPFTDKRQSWRGGKHYLSWHMCRQEIVGACLSAIKDAEMHEIHEWFKYRNVSIYNPHIDPDVLVEVAKYKRNLCVRQNAMSMEEPND